MKNAVNSANPYRRKPMATLSQAAQSGRCNDYSRRGSRAKRLQVLRVRKWDGDIVWTASKDAAALTRGGWGVANPNEQADDHE
jgi:hypothetical protein